MISWYDIGCVFAEKTTGREYLLHDIIGYTCDIIDTKGNHHYVDMAEFEKRFRKVEE